MYTQATHTSDFPPSFSLAPLWSGVFCLAIQGYLLSPSMKCPSWSPSTLMHRNSRGACMVAGHNVSARATLPSVSARATFQRETEPRQRHPPTKQVMQVQAARQAVHSMLAIETGCCCFKHMSLDTLPEHTTKQPHFRTEQSLSAHPLANLYADMCQDGDCVAWLYAQGAIRWSDLQLNLDLIYFQFCHSDGWWHSDSLSSHTHQAPQQQPFICAMDSWRARGTSCQQKEHAFLYATCVALMVALAQTER